MITSNTEHFLLTRFNVRLASNSPRPDDEWLESRIDYFHRYCVASLQAQTCLAFTWLIFLDSDTPDWFRERLSELQRATGELFEPVYVDGLFDGTVAGDAIRTRTTKSAILSTRIDNDDAVARDFIEAIQGAAAGKFEFINFIDGAQLAASGVYARPYPSNPFISVFELVGADVPRTVFMDEHPVLGRHGPIRDLRTGHPMWMQVVHGGNIANEVVGFRVHAKKIRPWYDIEIPADRSPVGLLVSQVESAARIGVRLIRKPSRMLALARSVGVKRGGS